MARKTKTITINSGNPNNRDEGKRFLITEMPAMQGEKWAIRAGQAVFGAGLADGVIANMLSGERENVVTGMASLQGIGALAIIKGLANAPWFTAEALLDEMMACVKFIPTAGTEATAIPLNQLQDTIEEVPTIWKLRQEAIELHTGFSLADVQSKLTSAMEAAQTSSNIPTSQPA